MQFNKQQQDAIDFKEGACAVIAGAGSGKSTVLVNRINNLREDGVNEKDIIATSFTRNSANDLKSKLNKLGIKGVTTGTFHSICNKILMIEGIDTSKKLKEYEIENIFKKANNNEKVDWKDIIAFISYQKNYMITYDGEFVYKDSKYSEIELRKFFKTYEIEKKKLKAYDWDDVLLEGYKALLNNPSKHICKYILVDEHQDSNLIQNKLIRLLCPSNNVFCVFDYRQAIYTFRGGNPEYCMNFNKEYTNARVINLDINYRSSSNIVKNANNFIKRYYGTYEHYSDSIPSTKVETRTEIISSYDTIEESESVINKIKEYKKNGVKANDIAILYRLNSQTDCVQNELQKNRIDYFIDSEGGFFKRKEIDMVMCVLRLIHNPSDNIAYETLHRHRITPFKFLKKEVIENIVKTSAKMNISFLDASEVVRTEKSWQSGNLKDFSNSISKLSRQHKQGVSLEKLVDNVLNLLQITEFIKLNYSNDEDISDRLNSIENFKKFMRNNTLETFIQYVYEKNKFQKDNNEDKVQLMTIHKAKGLEFKIVFIIGVEDGKFPHKKADIEDEARLFYVAITRPKEDLYISQISEENRFVEEYINEVSNENKAS